MKTIQLLIGIPLLFAITGHAENKKELDALKNFKGYTSDTLNAWEEFSVSGKNVDEKIRAAVGRMILAAQENRAKIGNMSHDVDTLIVKWALEYAEQGEASAEFVRQAFLGFPELKADDRIRKALKAQNEGDKAYIKRVIQRYIANSPDDVQTKVEAARMKEIVDAYDTYNETQLGILAVKSLMSEGAEYMPANIRKVLHPKLPSALAAFESYVSLNPNQEHRQAFYKLQKHSNLDAKTKELIGNLLLVVRFETKPNLRYSLLTEAFYIVEKWALDYRDEGRASADMLAEALRGYANHKDSDAAKYFDKYIQRIIDARESSLIATRREAEEARDADTKKRLTKQADETEDLISVLKNFNRTEKVVYTLMWTMQFGRKGQLAEIEAALVPKK